ncbi:MAG TPA: tetratricopeptide repeat protein, partial [Planctomycetota bacterium]|nr:tetratricopeptide repeat protein [Planctomycetota bacterium]
MRPLAFVLVLLLAAFVLLPSETDVFGALRRSAPRPEMEPYFLERLARDPGSLDVLRELVRIARARGDLETERERRLLLRRRDPGDVENLEELLRVLGWTGRSEEAFSLARELADRFPERRDLQERVLDLAMVAARPAEAASHARRLLQRGVRHAAMGRVFAAARDVAGLRASIAPPRARAEALTALGAQAEAIVAWREHLAQAPGDADARRSLARLYLWNGRPMDAAAELEACLALEGDPAVREELVGLYRSLNRIDLLLPHLPAGSLERADVLAALGRVEEAWRIYFRQGRLDRLLELSRGMPFEEEELAIRRLLPPTRENRRRQADLYAWRKDFARALELYESLDDPRAVEMHLALGDFEGALAAARRLGLHARAGDLLQTAGDLEGAIAEYERVPGARAELARLYLQVGRRADAARVLDALAREGGTDPHLRAELYLYAGRIDRAVATLRRLSPEEFEAWRVERLARGAPPRTAEPLWRLLLDRDPENEEYLLALSEILQALGRLDEAAGILARLLERRPDDALLLGALGLLRSDRALLERARARGSRDPRVYKRLAEIARAEYRRADAAEHYREYHRLRDDDPQSHFALGELTGDPAEFRRAWELLPPGERRLRARLLARWGRASEAEALFRAAGDVEGLVDFLLGQGRLDEARRFPMTPRQRADLALREGRRREAVELLRALDLRDPDVRSALGEALFALGRWREAEEVADPELRRRIRARYGPESVAEARWLGMTDERHRLLSARAR